MPLMGRAIRGTSISRSGLIWLPRLRETVQVQVTLAGRDITSDILNASFTHPTLRNGLGSCTLSLNNNQRKYANVFKEGDSLILYADFADATTKIFNARIEDPRYGFDNGFKVFLNGIKNPELAYKKYTRSYSGVTLADALASIFGDSAFAFGAFSVFGSSNYEGGSVDGGGTVDTDDVTNPEPDPEAGTEPVEDKTSITIQYEEEPVISVVRDLLERTDFDGYIDVDNGLNTFADTGRLNTEEAAIQGQNILKISPFGKDTLKRRNIVKVYGATLEECPILKTVIQETTSWDKEEIIKNGEINDLSQASLRVKQKLNDFNALPQEGTITCPAMPTIRPGDRISCRVPDANIEGEYYIPQYTHNFSTTGGWTTTITVSKIPTSLFIIHEEQKTLFEKSRELNNPNGMLNTLILETFDDENNISSLSDCSLFNGGLVLDSGKDTGVMITNTFSNPRNFSAVELRGTPNTDFSLGPSTIEVSNDNGVTWAVVSGLKTSTDISSTGKRGKIRVTIKSNASYPSPTLGSICMLVNS